MGLTPARGDLVISSRTNSPTVYIVSPFNGPESLIYTTMDSAIKDARRCVNHIQVNLWFLASRGSFVLLAECRPATCGD
jgi:hypothetical protein